MLDELSRVKGEAHTSLQQVQNTEELEEWHKLYLGKKGALTVMLRSVGSLPKEERPLFGRTANEARAEIEAAYEARSHALERGEMAEELQESAIDVTLPGRPVDQPGAPARPGRGPGGLGRDPERPHPHLSRGAPNWLAPPWAARARRCGPSWGATTGSCAPSCW